MELVRDSLMGILLQGKMGTPRHAGTYGYRPISPEFAITEEPERVASI